MFAIAVLAVFLFGFFYRVSLKESIQSFFKPPLPEPKLATEFKAPQKSRQLISPKINTPPSILNTSSSLLPPPINLQIPFGSQAPFADWSLPYQEACEEATIIMVHRYFTGETLTPAEMNAEILKLVAWQEKTFGYYKDTTAEEMARMLREYFGHADIEMRYEFTIEDIKKEVAAGYPVILPAAGRLLPNPNFKQPGPIYHALVVKGFLANGKIITNDPGTRKGADFLYDPTALMNAIHDWDPENILDGEKVMIVVKS
jgi:hypothetical protein